MAEQIIQRVEGILFDLDGVLRSTEPCHNTAYRHIAWELSEGTGFGDDVVGKSSIQMYTELVRRFGGTQTPQELSRKHFQQAYQLLLERHIGPCRGLDGLMGQMYRTGIAYGVVSSSARWFVEQNLRDLGMLLGAGCVVAGDDGFRPKPAPDMYLEGIARMGLPASSLIAVEDSFCGLTAAKAAGLRCVAFHNPDSGRQNLDAADWHCDDLSHLLSLTAMDAVSTL